MSYLAAAGGGLLSFLSPCVLPLVPAYVSFLAGTSLDQLTDDDLADRRLVQRGVVMSLAFVAGFTTVFVILGASASAINQLVMPYLDVIAKIAGVAIVVFGLHFMGLIRVPFLFREVRFMPRARPVGAVGGFVIGLAFGFGWTPCIGPILATILALAAGSDSLAFGTSLLTVYSLGLGIPFVIAAFAIKPFLGFMARFRGQMRRVEMAAGALLAVTGVLIFTNDLQTFSYWLLEMFPALGLIG